MATKTKAAPWMPDESYQEATHKKLETGVRLCCDKNVFVLSECVRLCPTSGHAQVLIWGLLETVGS